jgi:cholest-4-en-3-one 26-monooxygenase
MENFEELATRLRNPAFFLSSDFAPLLRHLRNESPVHWTQAWPDRGFWSVTRHRDIRDVLLKPTLFSSQAYGSLMPADPHMYDTPEAKADAAFGLIPTYTDPPRHDAVRRPFIKPFSPAGIAKLEQTCQRLCEELIDEMLPKGECDFVAEVAGKLPMHIICLMLGVPREDWDYVGKYVNSFVCNTEPEFQLGATPAETIQIAQRKQFEYVKSLVEERRARPRDDLTTLAAFAEVEGKPIDPEETFWSCWRPPRVDREPR